jgi:hypothetical protein
MNTTTATNTLQAVANDIVAYVSSGGQPWSRWYVGIASDPRRRLFVDHNVLEQGGLWIYRDAWTEEGARTVEKFFHETYGAQGDTGGGDSSTRFVYAYLVTNTTKE